MAGTPGTLIWLAQRKCFENFIFLGNGFIFVIINLISSETRTALLARCIV